MFYSLRVTSYIFVEFGGHICEQIIGITMGENCAPLLPDLFLYFQKQNTDAKAFNLTVSYIDDVLQIDNPNFVNCILLIYHKDIEITKTTETASSASFLDIYHKLDTNAGNGQLFTRLYGKGDDFNLSL